MPRGIWIRKGDAEDQLRLLLATLPAFVEDWRTIPCVEWDRSLNTQGYPQIWFTNKLMRVSRVSFFLAKGKFPDNYACHHCDNRKCIHPAHLFDGTTQENTQDALNKGRFPKGANAPTARHAKTDPSRVFDLNRAGCSQAEIASWLMISRPYVSRILSGQRRFHAPGS